MTTSKPAAATPDDRTAERSAQRRGRNGSTGSGAAPMKPMPVQQVQLVGRKIRLLRKQRKLTQTELAARVGIQQSDLCRMEKGQYRVSLDSLFRLLAEFDMGIGEFFDELGREVVSSRELRLMQRLRQLDETARDEVEEFIQFKRAQGPQGSAAGEEGSWSATRS